MPKQKGFRAAFTLIEVMVAVMIVSLVIGALLQMRGGVTNKYFTLSKMLQTNQYNSFLLSTDNKYGFEESNLDMKRLVDDFELESDLRRSLSAMKVKIDYEELESIDTSSFMLDDENRTEEAPSQEGNSPSGVIFEIGKTVLKTETFTSSLIRVRLQ